MEYGIQMYSVRDITGKDLRGALEAIAEIGYTYVEFAGFFGHGAKEVKAWLNDLGLKISGTHTGMRELDQDIDAVIDYHSEIGNKNIIIPGHDLNSQAKIDDFVDKVALYSPRLAKAGIRLGYHNHSHEFIPNADGSMIHDQLIYRTDLRIEVDTYWYFNATGRSSSGILERLKPRIDFIHIKDGMRGGEGKPLGFGQAPVKDAYNWARDNDRLMIVESESLKPDGLTEAKQCFDWLKSQE